MSSLNMQSLTCNFREKERQLTTLLQIYIARLNTVLYNEMICDRLVVGLSDNALLEKMQLNPRESRDYGPPKRGNPPTAKHCERNSPGQ